MDVVREKKFQIKSEDRNTKEMVTCLLTITLAEDEFGCHAVYQVDFILLEVAP